MIHSFRCKNFYSCKEEIEVSFVVNNKAPSNDNYFTTPHGIKLSKTEVVVGPNASGKTNILKVLPFIHWILVDAFNDDPSLSIPMLPFVFNDKKTAETMVSVDFEISGNVYTYDCELNKEKILSEKLAVRNKSKKKTTSKTLFTRLWNKPTGAYVVNDINFNFPRGVSSQRTNASIISSAFRSDHELSKILVEYWKSIKSNILESGLIEDRRRETTGTLHFFANSPKLKKQAEKILSHFDFGFNVLDISEQTIDNKNFLSASTVHVFDGREYLLPLKYESSGTKGLLNMLKTILYVLGNGGMAVIDEFEANLHPDISSEIFDLFIHQETNPHNAQLILSTHSHIILSKLDKYQIVLTEKNEQGSTVVSRLDQIKGVRPDDNYYSKYISGTYGAIPKLK